MTKVILDTYELLFRVKDGFPCKQLVTKLLPLQVALSERVKSLFNDSLQEDMHSLTKDICVNDSCKRLISD